MGRGILSVTAQLLCTFAKKWNLEETLESISAAYEVVFDKIFVLQNDKFVNEFFCTYNIEKKDHKDGLLKKTISIHRKKETNTLYTINSLNEVIKLQNNGVLDYNFKIDWAPYTSSILVTNTFGLKVIPTKLFEIVRVA